ncbi:hypothetical protein E4U42_001430 [Claviceps africana]|uniref:Translocation protein n=1 Tax=Claviceps africana TaxID=83212 RepID=A0A8K0J9F6_9HYPO|nr:hypothetical protein E4U42_001430 [Claviceps africana]
MSDLDHFDLLDLHMDPQSKTISANKPSRALNAELDELNALHRAVLAAGLKNGVTPAPIPVNGKRSGQIVKLGENGNAEYRKGKTAEAGRLYTLGIQMAMQRPAWEPAALVREEVSGLLANRAQVHMASQNWPDAAVDAEQSVAAKPMGNPKAWWRKGKCLVEMGRLEEARQWVKRGLEIEGEEVDLALLLKDIEASLEKARL